MNLLSYWVSNLIFDLIKSYVPVLISLGLIYAFDEDIPEIYGVFLLLPVGIVPFTYVLSFFFTKESIAQTVVIFINLIFAGIGSLVVTLLRFFESTLEVGDDLSKAFKIVPNFCLAEGIYILSEHSNMVLIREDTKPISEDVYALENMGGDLLALGLHFFFGLFVVFIFESFLLEALDSCIGRIRTRQVARVIPEDVDSDVENEDKRVGDAPQEFSVKVHRFRKVYYTLFGKPFTAV